MHLLPFNDATSLPMQASATMRGEPTPVNVRHRKLRRQRDHGSAAEQGTGGGVVGQAQVGDEHCSQTFSLLDLSLDKALY